VSDSLQRQLPGTYQVSGDDDDGGVRIRVISESPVYRPDAGDDDPHFLRDLVRWAESRDPHAGTRLSRYRQEQGGGETRDIGTGAVGALAVPQFLVDLAAGPVRPGDPFLQALEQRRLPTEGVTMTVPRSTTTGGTAAFSQTSENSAAAEVDPGMVNLERSVVTVAGQVTVSNQLLDRSPAVSEAYLAKDLLDAVVSNLDNQLISGTNANGQLLGLRTVTDLASVTWTDASPTRGEFVSRVARTAHDVAVARNLPPDLVVLHPRRWYWLTGALSDSSVDAATVVTDQVCAERPEEGPYVGTIAGLPVAVDANIPTAIGAGTNEDVALVVRAADMPVHLSPLTVDVDRQTDAGTAEVTLIGRRYAVWFPDRYRGTSVGVLTGTGLVAPGTW
jgi:hypothetical protein